MSYKAPFGYGNEHFIWVVPVPFRGMSFVNGAMY